MDHKNSHGQFTRRGFRWPVAFLLLTALFLNYIDRQTLAVLARFLPSEMRMSNIVYAHISSAFLLAYALAMPFVGWLIDRLGTRLGLGIAVSLWSGFEILCGASRSVFSLGAFRFLLGMAEASAMPSMSKVAAEHAAPHARATLIGIAMFGLGMGSTFAPPVAVFLTLHFSWRWAFFATGLAGFVWSFFWLTNYRGQFGIRSPAARPRGAEPWSRLLRNRTVLGLCLAHIFGASAWWFYLFWIPSFLNQERGFDIHDIGFYGWIPYFFAGIGSAFGGYASGSLVRRGWEPVRARRRIMWLCAAIVPFTSLVAVAHGMVLVLGILATATFFIQAFSANLFAMPADIFPSEKVASVVGVNVMCNSLAAIFTIQMTGHIVERFSYTPVFAAVALLLPIAVICAHYLAPSSEEISRAAAISGLQSAGNPA